MDMASMAIHATISVVRKIERLVTHNIDSQLTVPQLKVLIFQYTNQTKPIQFILSKLKKRD
jgi:hypothetical protein